MPVTSDMAMKITNQGRRHQKLCSEPFRISCWGVSKNVPLMRCLFRPSERESYDRAQFPAKVWVLGTKIARRKTVGYLGQARQRPRSWGDLVTLLITIPDE